jgi:hypothetical protein
VLLADHTHITARELERFMPSAATASCLRGPCGAGGGPRARQRPKPDPQLVRDYGFANAHSAQALKAALDLCTRATSRAPRRAWG